MSGVEPGVGATAGLSACGAAAGVTAATGGAPPAFAFTSSGSCASTEYFPAEGSKNEKRTPGVRVWSCRAMRGNSNVFSPVNPTASVDWNLSDGGYDLHPSSPVRTGAPIPSKFPCPETATFRLTGSPADAFLGDTLASMVNLPTAPEKSSGRPSFGSGRISICVGFVLRVTSRLSVNIPCGSGRLLKKSPSPWGALPGS